MKLQLEQLIPVLQTIYDPEIPVNIYDLGLIYDLDISETNDLHLVMTLTSPACPAAGFIADEVKAALEKVPGVGAVEVEIVFEPRWTAARMGPAAKAILGY